MTDEEDIEQRTRAIRKRIIKIANEVDNIPEEDYTASREAARSTLEERTHYLREARDKKWREKVPPRWSSWSINSLPKGFQVAANQWIAEGFPNSQNLILSGPTGSGKTSLAYAIGREIYLLGHKVKMWNTAELFESMRQAERAEVILESVKNADLLLLDDVGSERKTEWVEERMFLVVDHRWQWQLPTIVTTNLSTEELVDQVSERITSRLMDDSINIDVEGKDYRG